MEVRRAKGRVNSSLLRILDHFEVSPEYPPEVEEEVEGLLAAPGIDDPRLTDMTGLPFVTIDNEDSKDLDQALLIQRGEGGNGYIVRDALADASHFVKPGMALFDEALRRGVSCYLPGFVVPMLPPQLSEGIVSLNPRVDRRALVFAMSLDEHGECRSTTIERARIRSRAKLSYNGVQRFHDDPTGSSLDGRDFTESLQLLKEVGNIRLTQASERNMVQFRRREAVVVRSADSGWTFEITEDVRNDVSLWNEQISLLCNIEGGRFLSEDPQPHVQPIYRIHDKPTPESLDHLVRVIEQLADIHDLSDEPWKWQRHGPSACSLAAYLDGLPQGETTDRIRQAIERQILVMNQRSRYSDEPGRHFALGVQPYTRFSAPMREIVGIFTHKEALEKLGVVQAASSPDQDEELRERVIESANAAKVQQDQITKAVTRLAVDEILRHDLMLPLSERPRYSGTIVGVRPTRIYVQLDEPIVSLKVYVAHLEAKHGARFACVNDDLELVPRERIDAPTFRVGEGITVRCHDFDQRTGKWALLP